MSGTRISWWGLVRLTLVVVLLAVGAAIATDSGGLSAFAESQSEWVAPQPPSAGISGDYWKQPNGIDRATGQAHWLIKVHNPNNTSAPIQLQEHDNEATVDTGSPTGGTCSGDLSSPTVCWIPANGWMTIALTSSLGSAGTCGPVDVENGALIWWRASLDDEHPWMPLQGMFAVQTAGPATSDPACTPNPGIHLAKAASTNTLPAGGGPVTYTYTVTNTGNVPLTGVTVTDDVCSPVTYQSGDANNDGKLDIAETWTYTCTQTLTASTTNTGTAIGHSGDATVTSQSQASVTVEQSQTITQTLTVHKVVSPASDGGTFDLTIDGTTVASGVGNGGSGSLQVSAGQHTVGETAHAGTSLSDYTVSYSSNCPNGVVTVAAGANADCTITNTRKSTPETPTPTATPETPTPTATPTTTETPFIPPLVVVTPTPTPTAQPTETQPPTQPPKTPTAIDTVAGEKTPGPAATPKPPETGTGAAYDWFHSNQALEVIALFILSAVLSGLVVLTTPGKKRD